MGKQTEMSCHSSSILQAKWLRFIPSILVCIVVTFSAWAFGGAETWAIYVLAGVSLVAFGFARLHPTTSRTAGLRGTVGDKVARAQGCKGSGEQPFSLSGFISNLSIFQYFSPPATLCVAMWAGFSLFIFISILNPSHSYSVADQGLTVLPHLSWLPTTVSRPASINAFLLLLSYFAVYWITSRMIKRGELNLLVGIIIAGAVCMALLALLQGSGYERWELVGMFLNENSFSSYINLIFPVALGSARTLQRRAKRRSSRSNPAVLLYFCAGILAASVLLSGSRAGAVITILILSVWVVMELFDYVRSKSRSKYGWIFIVLPVLPVAGLLFLLGMEIWQTELTKPGAAVVPHIMTRISVVRETWLMFLEKPVFGIGAGGFHAAFPYYQDATVLGFYRHAHNDWIQWLAEFGVVGCCFGVMAVAMAFRRCSYGGKRPYVSSFVTRGMWLGLAGVSLHSMIDFPFRIPAIAVIVAVWIGALCRRRGRKG